MSYSYRRTRGPVRSAPRTIGEEIIDPPVPVGQERADPAVVYDGYLQPPPVPLVRLNWPLASQALFAPASFYSEIRARERPNDSVRSMERRATVAHIYNALLDVYYAQDQLEDAIRFFGARRASAVARLKEVLQEAQEEPALLAAATQLTARRPPNTGEFIMPPEFSMFHAADFSRIISEYTPCILCETLPHANYHTTVQCQNYRCSSCGRPGPGHSIHNCNYHRNGLTTPQPNPNVVSVGSLLRQGLFTDKIATQWRALVNVTLYDSEQAMARLHYSPTLVPVIFLRMRAEILDVTSWFIVDQGRVCGIFASREEGVRNTTLRLDAHGFSARNRGEARQAATRITREDWVDASILGIRDFEIQEPVNLEAHIFGNDEDHDDDDELGPEMNLPIPVSSPVPTASPPPYEHVENVENFPLRMLATSPTSTFQPSPDGSVSSQHSERFDLVNTRTDNVEAVVTRGRNRETSILTGAGTAENPHEGLGS